MVFKPGENGIGSEGRYVLTPKERFAVNRLLDQHVIRTPGNPKVSFEAGWSDEQIAKVVRAESGPQSGVAASHVQRIRRSALGELIAPRGSGKSYGQLSTRKRVDDLISKHNALCESLGVPDFVVHI